MYNTDWVQALDTTLMVNPLCFQDAVWIWAAIIIYYYLLVIVLGIGFHK